MISSELVSPRVRRNNVVTLVLLILFAIGLCAFVLISMRVHAQRRAAHPEAALGCGDLAPLSASCPRPAEKRRQVAALQIPRSRLSSAA